ETVLATLRPFAPGKLVVVFGCGGDRDRAKRPVMGEIATRLADLTLVTDDNPRSEEPAAIRAEIVRGIPGERKNWTEVRDGRHAVARRSDRSAGPSRLRARPTPRAGRGRGAPSGVGCGGGAVGRGPAGCTATPDLGGARRRRTKPSTRRTTGSVGHTSTMGA